MSAGDDKKAANMTSDRLQDAVSRPVAAQIREVCFGGARQAHIQLPACSGMFHPNSRLWLTNGRYAIVTALHL